LQGGDKVGAGTLGRRFAAEGIAVASVNYRLSPQVKFPAYIDDAAAACAFVRREVARYGGSPHRVFVSGHSAGGYLTAMIGVDPQYLSRYDMKPSDLAGLLPVSGQMITHSTVRSERGIARARPIIDEAAPAYHVTPNAPPLLAIAGGADLPTRAEENRYFVAAMKAAGHNDATYLEFAGRNHGSIANRLGEPGDEVANAILEFIARKKRNSVP
jgi:acetyl esterase/lipase